VRSVQELRHAVDLSGLSLLLLASSSTTTAVP
jgi:hypothetical protein